jgi:hypothetical protein
MSTEITSDRVWTLFRLGFAPVTQQRLRQALPGCCTVRNPLDVTGAAVIDPTVRTKAIEAVSDDPAVGTVAVISGPSREATGAPIRPRVTQCDRGRGTNDSGHPGQPGAAAHRGAYEVDSWLGADRSSDPRTAAVGGRATPRHLRSRTIDSVHAASAPTEPVTVEVTAPRHGTWSNRTLKPSGLRPGSPKCAAGW